MPGVQIALPWGSEQLTLSLPKQWSLLGVLVFPRGGSTYPILPEADGR